MFHESEPAEDHLNHLTAYFASSNTINVSEIDFKAHNKQKKAAIRVNNFLTSSENSRKAEI